MHGKSVILRSSGTLSAAELGCQVYEKDTVRKESFTADWKDLSLTTRPEEAWSLSEVDKQRRETYHQQQEARVIVQRSPWGILRLGLLGEPLVSYHLPYERALPLPIFTPAKLATKAERELTPTPSESVESLPPAGVCPDKTPLEEITKELPLVVQPSCPDFKKAGLPRSLSRSLSQEAQRG
ncbi:Telethonin [Varanus komodoensis]|uniref:Titin-cap n=1 Tax=Varanus komodoensis TaxID=61221 RepID=A0A8D2LBB1_VARKO|nr:telethonin [Varanus komodoensis]KAF7239163.1 Telethonin [Varanus komodoensis]